MDASTPGSELVDYFEKHPEAPGVVLTHDGVFAAALAREEFLQALTQPLGIEIFSHRPLSSLIDRPSFRPMLSLPGDLTASEALARALERGGERPVLVEGSTSMAHLKELVAAGLDALRKTREALETATAARTQSEKELEQARRETGDVRRSKSEFLAHIGHEIRTPMNGVIGMTSLLLDAGLPPKEREYTRTIQSSANHLLDILNEFLDFSKAEAHALTLDTADFNLLEIVESVIEKYGPQTAEKGVELAEFAASSVPAYLRGDPARLGQVLDHLVNNAVKFTEKGEVVVTISLETEPPTGVLLRFEVRDTGTGIAPELRETLFEPMTHPAGRSGAGAGLGLAISKQLVELMGGQIGVQNAPGGGSLFWFTAHFEKQTGTPENAATEPLDLCGLRALIVDDNPTNRHILHCQLSSWRMVPTCVSNAEEALATLKNALAGKPFDLALLDMQMPGADGLELARAIKADPAMASLRLIILTSLGPLPQHEYRAAGVTACLVKPVKQSLLHNHVASVIAQPPLCAEQPGQALSPSMKSRILVAEDNVINQMVTMGQLDKLGYHGDLAVNGMEVLEALRKNDYPIILMDCQMPLLDGYETTRRIRANQDLPRQPRIIAVTAHAMAGDSAKCLAAGMDDYISKPVKLEDLAAKIAHWENTPYAPASGTPEPAPEPGSAPGGGEPSLDPERLETLKNLDPDNGAEFYRKLLETFVESAGNDFRQLREAITERAWDRVKTKAHSLKGSSRNMGADAMGKLCQQLEALSLEPEKTGEIQATLERLAEEFAKVSAEIRTELSGI